MNTLIPIKNMQGLSLIEMMVSMVLGLFLIGGLSTMYLSSKKSDKTRAQVSDMEANARVALSSIRLAIEHAGYKSVENIPLEKPFQTPSDGSIVNQFCRDGQALIINPDLINPPSFIHGYTKDGNGSGSDRITVIYRADSPERGPILSDCASGDYAIGNSNQAQDRARQVACSTNRFNGMNSAQQSKIYNGIYVNNTDKTLRCYGSRNANGSQVLADNIENMQILYGLTIGDKTKYKKASKVDLVKNGWESVTSVQVAILIGSDKETLEYAKDQTFKLLDKTITKTHDKKLYRVYSTTINLPNRSRRDLDVRAAEGAGALLN